MSEKTLKSSICIPSTIHAYSLSMEFIKDWFLSKFNSNYFKTIHIDQKHIFDDFRKSDMYNNLKKLKPSLAIIPQINFDYDRERLDMYGADLNLYIKRHNVNSSFFADGKKNIYLDLRLEQLETSYTFKMRVSTRAQQVDLFKMINMSFRVGTTQGHYVAMDFHIPYSIMIQLAQDSGFEIDDGNIVDIIGFLEYINMHSSVPITYKLRTINGRHEFFLRINEVYVHISCLDPLSADDGEREGMLYSNYIIEFNVIVKIPAPKFYVYYSQNNHEYIESIEPEENHIGLYNIRLPDIPETNEKGWEQYLVTSFCADTKGIVAKIEFYELFRGSELERVCEYCKKMKISPSVFIDFYIFENGERIEWTVDWDNYILFTKKEISYIMLEISIYVDILYLKDQLITLKELSNKRINVKNK